MLLRSLPVCLLFAPAVFSDVFTQPLISPNGVVNAASYFSPGLPNSGIARGSLFLIFGNVLGPSTLVQASSYPLPTSEGLAGTKVAISAGSYHAFAPVLYTSATVVAAILPSSAPEGGASLTVLNGDLTSNLVQIQIVRSGFGIFTLNQAGNGPAVIQNFVSATESPLNSLVTSAAPGQTVTLWGTGLGPVAGDEASGPLPGQLTYLDSVYVGGQAANVRYAGRSGCCAGVDQIVFDVPAGISGCYVPVAVQAGGSVGNFGTMSVAASGNACGDSSSFRAADMAILQQKGALRIGQVQMNRQANAGNSTATTQFTADFSSYTSQALPLALAPIQPPVGSCYVTEARVSADYSSLPHSTPLNAGATVTARTPEGLLNATSMVSGSFSYSAAQSPVNWPAGTYSLSADGGSDVGAFQTGTFGAVPGAAWTNVPAFSVPILFTGLPMTFTWTGGDSNGYIAIQVTSADANVGTSIRCNVAAAAGRFTVPDFILRALVPHGQGVISLASVGAPVTFSAGGLDVGVIRMSATTSLTANFQSGNGSASNQ